LSVRLQVVFRRPTLLFTSGCHVFMLRILLLSLRKTWPIHLIYIISSLAFVASALMCNSTFDIVSGHLILNIFLRRLFWNVSCSVVFQPEYQITQIKYTSV